MTGGTGFVGTWLLESFAWLNERLSLEAHMIVLSRSPELFRQRAPHLACLQAIDFIEGDVREFSWPDEKVDYVIHGAAQADARLNRDDPLLMLDTIVIGTRNVLEFSRARGIERFLFLSSGAVYGKQPQDISHIPEDFPGAPDLVDGESAYGESKRLGELACAIYHRRFRLHTVVARPFALLGPYLNLDIHFAVGNFIRNGLQGGPIEVKGDGTPYRSYLYTADLAVWLWTLLLRGQPGSAYNVGSEHAVTIAELAHSVAGCFQPQPEVTIRMKADPTRPQERYVPSTERARTQLGLLEHIGLNEALRRTIGWYHSSGVSGR